MHPGRVFGGAFGLRPLVEHLPFARVELGVHLGRAHVGGQFQAVAVGVKKVDALEDGVVGGAQHVDARGLQPVLGRQQFVHRTHLQRSSLQR